MVALFTHHPVITTGRHCAYYMTSHLALCFTPDPGITTPGLGHSVVTVAFQPHCPGPHTGTTGVSFWHWLLPPAAAGTPVPRPTPERVWWGGRGERAGGGAATLARHSERSTRRHRPECQLHRTPAPATHTHTHTLYTSLAVHLFAHTHNSVIVHPYPFSTILTTPSNMYNTHSTYTNTLSSTVLLHYVLTLPVHPMLHYTPLSLYIYPM